MALITFVFLLVVTAFVFWQKDFFFPDENPASLQIAVVLADNTLVQQSALREGMELAAYDFNCELTIVAPLKPYDMTEQNELINQTLRRTPDAWVLSPVDIKVQASFHAPSFKKIPLAIINSPDTNLHNVSIISPNYGQMADQLAKRILLELPQLERAVICFTIDADPTREIKLLLQSEFSRLGVKCVLMDFSDAITDGSSGDEPLQFLNQVDGAHNALICMDGEALSTVLTLSNEQENQNSVPQIYALAADITAVSYLEKGSVKLLVQDNQFTSGYLAIKYLAELLRRGKSIEDETIDFALIDRDNLDLIANQYLLFPIIQ